MTTIYVVGRMLPGIFNVNIFQDGYVVHYGSMLSREKILQFQADPEYKVVVCDTTIRL